MTRARNRSNQYERTRRAHKNETAEDYVEAIADLIEEKGEARGVDLAARMGVSNVTVSRIVSRLKRLGYVNYQPYRPIFLTDEGRRLADESQRRHGIVLAFLQNLGIAGGTASSDAEGIEHHVSEETLRAFKRISEVCASDPALRKKLSRKPKT